MPKLTLSVDERVIRRAKKYAQARGTSVSKPVARVTPAASPSTACAVPASSRS